MSSTNSTEVKTYKVTPKTNRFIPDILKNNGRIEYPGVYQLNEREVHRVLCYGHAVEEIDPEKPDPDKPKPDPGPGDIYIPDKIPDNPDDYLIMYAGKIGRSKLYPYKL